VRAAMATFFLAMYTLCAAQAVFVFLLLWTRRQNVLSNRLLAAAIVVVGVSAFYTVYARAGWYTEYPGWLFAIDTLPALYGPIFYLYARALLRQDVVLERAWPHFVPFVAYTLWHLPWLLASGRDKLAIITHREPIAAPLREVLDWCVELQGAGYLVACLLMVREYRRALRDTHSNLDRRRLGWLGQLLGTLLAIWIGGMLAHATGLPLLAYVHVVLTATIYVIAYRNAVEPELFQPLRAPVAAVNAAAASIPERLALGSTMTPQASLAPASAGEAAEAPVRYQKAGLSPESAATIAERLASSFRSDQPYLDPDFTLAALAERLGVSPHHVSQVLNEKFGLSFYDYVNDHRVEELKRRLVEPTLAREKVLSIGFDCGFSSKSSLNSNFKKRVGMTPTEYRRREPPPGGVTVEAASADVRAARTSRRVS
jgi:AraC-like DNA-binding protein